MLSVRPYPPMLAIAADELYNSTQSEKTPPLATVVALVAMTSLMTTWPWTVAGIETASEKKSKCAPDAPNVCQITRINFDGFTIHKYITFSILPTPREARQVRCFVLALVRSVL